jgi:hypothetical protein
VSREEQDETKITLYEGDPWSIGNGNLFFSNPVAGRRGGGKTLILVTGTITLGLDQKCSSRIYVELVHHDQGEGRGFGGFRFT